MKNSSPAKVVPTQKERVDGIHKGMKDGTITPVACVSAQNMEGIDLLCKELELLVPTVGETDEIPAETASGELTVLHPAAGEPVCAQVYQTLSDPFVGKLSMLRVVSGTLKAGAELVNAATGSVEKSVSSSSSAERSSRKPTVPRQATLLQPPNSLQALATHSVPIAVW